MVHEINDAVARQARSHRSSTRQLSGALGKYALMSTIRVMGESNQPGHLALPQAWPRSRRA